MSFIPDFELGFWNAWILEVLFLATMFSGYLIDKKANKRFGVVPPYGKTAKNLFLVTKLMTIVTFAYSIFLPSKLGTTWFYVGLPICLLALTMSFIVGVNFASTPPNQPATKGFYHISRNPAYLSIFLIDIGIGITCISWIFLLFAIISITLANNLVVYEERFCLAKYGDVYQEYMNRTPRWIGIPKPRKNN